jgi:hypothetical protein
MVLSVMKTRLWKRSPMRMQAQRSLACPSPAPWVEAVSHIIIRRSVFGAGKQHVLTTRCGAEQEAAHLLALLQGPCGTA